MPPNFQPLNPVRKIGPLFESKYFKDVKDPCIAYDGTTWHIYGSGGTVITEEWELLHATAPDIEGPWTELSAVQLIGLSGPHVAAPTVVFDPEDKLFHMGVQQDFMDVGGGIEYLVSADGHVFSKMRALMQPNGSAEAGLYDPHLSIINGKKYMVYSGIPSVMPNGRAFVPQPDAYLSRSATGLWSGPWRRTNRILTHEDIAWHHNSREDFDYEWGIEGPQIVELPNGKILLNATCFMGGGKRGTRQRVFFAIADDVRGPYTSIGPVLTDQNNEWESGENGHASAWVKDNELYLFYQARSQKEADEKYNDWRYGIAVYNIEEIMRKVRHEERAQQQEAQFIEELVRAEAELAESGEGSASSPTE